MVFHDSTLPNEVGKYNAQIVEVAINFFFTQKPLKNVQKPVSGLLANSVTLMLSATAAHLATLQTNLILNEKLVKVCEQNHPRR